MSVLTSPAVRGAPALHAVVGKTRSRSSEAGEAGPPGQDTVVATRRADPRRPWAFTTPDRTIYRVEESRGKDVVFDTLGAHFGGVPVTDCPAGCQNLPFTMHKCYAHHLEPIAQARDRKPEDQRSFFNELTGVTAIRHGIGSPAP